MKNIFSTILILLSMQLIAQMDEEHLSIGDTAPPIIGVDQNGKTINSSEILKTKKILMVFYRGNWCPHCKKHLSSLEEHLNEFTEKGVFVFVVTPETVERTKETAKIIGSSFSIIHDVNNKIMNDYKVAFEVNKENVPNYYNIVSKKVDAYNVTNNRVLPVPATYLIDMDGKISYVQYDPNYKNRVDFSDLLKSL